MTGRPIEGPSDAIWDDGEWISWDWINDQLSLNEIREMYPKADPFVVEIFSELIELAGTYKEHTNRHLDIFGELGELFAEIVFGIKRHKPKTPGSDGRVGNDFIEVKTISPLKKSEGVLVKRTGNFNKLVVVKVSDDLEFEARIVDRKKLKKGNGKYVKVKWSNLEKQADQN